MYDDMTDDMTDQDQPPQTLPGDFFDRQQAPPAPQQGAPQQPAGAPPQTLPGDFFDKMTGGDKVSDLSLSDLVTGKQAPTTPYGNFAREHPWLTAPVDLLGGAGAGVFHTARGATQLVNKGASYLPGSPQLPVIPARLATPPDTLAGKIGFGGEQIGEFFLPGGQIDKASKAMEITGLAAKSAPKTAALANAVTRGVAEAVPAAGISLAQTGGDWDAAWKSGAVAGGLGATLPLVGKILSHWAGATTGAGEVPITRAATQATPELKAAMAGDITEQQILKATQAAVENVEFKRSADFIAQLKKLDPRIRVDLTPARKALSDVLDNFSVRKLYNPQSGRWSLNFGDSSLRLDEPAQQRVTKLFDEMMRPQNNSPAAVQNLKRSVDGFYRDTRSDRAIAEATRQALSDTLAKQVPGYQKMVEDYAHTSAFLDDLADLSTDASNSGTAIRKLAGSLKQNNNYRLNLLEALDQYTNKDLVGQISGSRLNPWFSRGIVGAMHGAGGGAGAGYMVQQGIHNPLAMGAALMGFFGMSPRLVGEAATRARLISRFAKSGGAAYGSGTFNVTGQQPDYDVNYYGNSVLDGKAKGGRVKYDEGGDVDDGSDDEVLRELKRRQMAQAGDPGVSIAPDPATVRAFDEAPGIPFGQRGAEGKPTGNIAVGPGFGKFQQAPIKIDPQKAKEQVFGPERPLPPKEGEEATISAAGTPGAWDYLKGVVREGQIGRAFGQSSETAEARKEEGQSWNAPLLRFETGIPQGTVGHDVAQMASGLTTPANMGIMAATGGVGALEGQAGSSILSNLISAGFSADMIKGAYDQIPQARAAWDRGDTESFKRILVQMGTQTAMGVAAGAHAFRTAPDTVGLRELPTKLLEGIPSKEALDTASIAASARLRASGVYGGATLGSTGGNAFQHIKDIATLTGADLGSGAYAVGEKAAARARQIRDYMAEWRRREFTPEESTAFDQARKDYPNIGEDAEYMTPLEARKMLASPKQVEAMSRLLRVLPQSEKMTAMALGGADKVGWYRGSAQALQDVFGADAPRFAQLLAALSPRISVEGNLTNALNVWKNWVQEGRPQDHGDILRIMAKSVQGSGTEKSAMEAWRNNTYSALTSEDPMSLTLSGPKVDSFQHNLRDHVFHVTNDAWMANAYNVAQDLFSGAGKDLAAGNPGMTTQYAGASARLRRGAAEAGMFPSQGQEAIWSVAMQLYELARQNKMDPREVLQKGLLTPEAIRGTPDFSTLLRHPEYLRILDEAGYGDAARAMKPFVFDQAQRAGMTPQQQQLLMEAAGTINETMSMRDRESRAGQFAVPRGWTGKIPKATSTSPKSLETREQMLSGLYPDRASGVTNLETIPGESTGHLPGIAQLPPSGLEHYTSTTYGAEQDLAGRDIIQNASGLATTPSKNVQGAYLNAVGQARYKAGLPIRPQDIETNPGRALGYETPIEWHAPGEKPGQPIPYSGRLEPSMNPQTKADLEGAMATHALVNAQEAVGSNVMIPTPGEAPTYDVPPEPVHKDLVVPLESEVSADRIRTAQRRYPQYGFASAGPDMHVLGLGNGIKHSDAIRIQRLLGGESFTPAENVGTYVDVADKWNRLWGSREVTGEVLDKIKRMSPDAYTRLDQDVRQVAGDALENYKKYERTKKTPARPDLMNALDIILKTGLEGLQGAYNNKAFLPGVAAAVLLPPLLKSANDAEKSRVR